jgi:DNA-binding NtrC family response regulator
LAASAIPQASETILVVDDDQDMCWVLEVALAGLGYVVKTVGTAQSAIASVADHAFPVAFVDARLPDLDGLRLVEELRGLRPAMRIIMISGYYLEDDARILKAMRESRIDGFLAKPFQIETIVKAAIDQDNGNFRPCSRARPPAFR